MAITYTAGILAMALMQAAANPSAPMAAEERIDWKAAAHEDVLAAYDLYVANHPGMHDPGNPGFPQQLERARNAGLVVAARASTAGDYGDALGAFSAEIGDGHARAFSNQSVAGQSSDRFWPGFIAAWRGRMLIQHAGPGSPAPAGSQILACDGLQASDFVRSQIAYRGFRPREAGQWWSRSTQAFFTTEGLWSGPKRCEFLLPDGSRRDVELAYHPAPAGFGDMVANATDGERMPIGLSEVRPKIFLIGMQDFAPGEDGVRAYRDLFDALRKRRPELIKARAVVIDMRHNNGGSSEWSRQGARLLWGERPVDLQLDDYFRNVRVWWRASPGNAAHVAQLEGKVRKDGNIEVADALHQIAAGLNAAVAKGDVFYVEGDEPAVPERVAGSAVSDFRTPVYVITPGRCASACLDAVDTFVRFANVKLIGAPTSGDSPYMDVRVADLPSGQGRLVIPNKMWVGRPRAGGEVYGPHIQVTDLDWSTATFLDHVERDISRW